MEIFCDLIFHHLAPMMLEVLIVGADIAVNICDFRETLGAKTIRLFLIITLLITLLNYTSLLLFGPTRV